MLHVVMTAKIKNTAVSMSMGEAEPVLCRDRHAASIATVRKAEHIKRWSVVNRVHG